MKKYGLVALAAAVVALCALFIQGNSASPELSGLEPVLAVIEPARSGAAEGTSVPAGGGRAEGTAVPAGGKMAEGTSAPAGGRRAEGTAVPARDGMIVLAGSDGLDCRLYEVDGDGTVKGYQVIRGDDRMVRRRVLQLAVSEDTVYAVIEDKSRAAGTVMRYQVAAVCREDGAVKVVAEAGPELLARVTDLEVEEDSLMLCGVLQGEPYLAGFRIALEEPDSLKLAFLQPVPAGEEAADARYAGDILYLLTTSGRVGRYTVSGFEELMKEGEEGQFAFLVKGEDQVWCYDRFLGRMIPVNRREAAGFGLPEKLQVQAAAMVSPEEGIFLGEQGGIPVLAWQEHDAGREVYELKAGGRVSLLLARPYIPRTLCIVALGAAFFLFAWWVFGKNGRISLKLSFLCLVACLALGVLWAGWLVSNGTSLLSQKRLLFTGLAVILILSAAFSVAVEAVTRPLRSLSRYMDRVSSGNYRIQKTPRTHDEVSEVWAGMNRMCNALEAGRYQYRQLLQSYYRFVPRDIEKIFRKGSITELAAGEVKEVDGTIGILTVQNRDSIRAGTSDEVYMELVKRFFLMLHDLYTQYGGILSDTEMDLSGVRILFPQKAYQAAAFGSELITVNRERRAGEGYPLDLFVLLHRTKFLYGLAGTKEQAFPFFSSAEMEYLASYIADFKKTNVYVVMTAQAAGEGEAAVSKRYIGYIPGKDGVDRYELYEVLDACPEAERVNKRNTEESFKEGLSLYYKRDFYLARNRFLEVLKECPKDGIARWYLFSSERYFNEGGGEAVDLSLFCREGKAGEG